MKLDAQLIPFIVSTTLRAEQSPGGPPPLSPADAVNLVEILDKVCTFPARSLISAKIIGVIRSCHPAL